MRLQHGQPGQAGTRHAVRDQAQRLMAVRDSSDGAVQALFRYRGPAQAAIFPAAWIASCVTRRRPMAKGPSSFCCRSPQVIHARRGMDVRDRRLHGVADQRHLERVDAVLGRKVVAAAAIFSVRIERFMSSTVTP